MRTAGSNRLPGRAAGNELRTRKKYVSDRDARFKQPSERCKLLTRWAFEYFDQTGLAAQRVEARIGCKILNTMTALGMPDSEMIG